MVKPVVFQHFHFSAPLGSNMHQNCSFTWMYSPLEQEAHSCKSVLHRVQQKSNFSGWMCLRMPSCRIWAAKQISKIPRKSVYYLHLSPSWGSLNFSDASNFRFLFFFIFRPFISLDFSTQSKFDPSFFWKYAPRLGRKQNSSDRHIPTWTLKIACSARSYALLKASWYRFSDFDPPSRQGLIAKNNSKLCIIFTIFIFATCFGSLGR